MTSTFVAADRPFPAHPVEAADPSVVSAAAAAPDDELAQLLARVALGHRESFTVLYERTRVRLFAVVLRIQKNREQAEDVLQEVYVNVWRAASGFDARLAQPLTWMCSIARHRAIDSLRRRQGEPTWVSTQGGGGAGEERDLLDEVPSDQAGPLEQLVQAAEALWVQRCLATLSQDQRQSLALAFYQGLSHSEVAEHLHQPLGSVKSWLRRGLQSLKGCLERAASVGTT